MRTRVLLFFALVVGLTFGSEDPEKDIEVEDAPNEEADRNAHYFTQETLEEMQHLDKYMNKRLWGCNLLTLCRMTLEQVFALIIEQKVIAELLGNTQEITNAIYTKIFVDLLSNCYDKLTDEEATQYENINDFKEIKCNSEKIAGILNFIPSNYKGLTAEDQLQPTMKQIILMSAQRVNLLLTTQEMNKKHENQQRMARKVNRGKSTIFGFDINDMSQTGKLVCVLVIVAIFAFVFWFLIAKVTKKPEKKVKKKRTKGE